MQKSFSKAPQAKIGARLAANIPQVSLSFEIFQALGPRKLKRYTMNFKSRVSENLSMPALKIDSSTSVVLAKRPKRKSSKKFSCRNPGEASSYYRMHSELLRILKLKFQKMFLTNASVILEPNARLLRVSNIS